MIVESKKVLVCEDEEAIREFIVIHLKRSGYEVFDADCGEKAVDLWNSGLRFDVAVLDIMMPGMDGCQVCKFLRSRSETMGIIMLSAKSREMDKVNSLMMGADDYITKPFSPSELVARVDAVYRRVSLSRPSEEINPDISSGPFYVDSRRRTITKNGKLLELTQVEYHILEYFIKNEGNPIDRDTLLERIWGCAYCGD